MIHYYFFFYGMFCSFVIGNRVTRLHIMIFFFFNDTATTEIYTYLTHSFPTRRSSDLDREQRARHLVHRPMCRLARAEPFADMLFDRLDHDDRVVDDDADREHEIGRAHVCTPVTNAHLVCRLLLGKK